MNSHTPTRTHARYTVQGCMCSAKVYIECVDSAVRIHLLGTESSDYWRQKAIHGNTEKAGKPQLVNL